MDYHRNQEQNARQKLSEGYRWLWVGLVFGLVVLATMMDSCFGY